MADEGLSCERQKLRGHIDNPLQNRTVFILGIIIAGLLRKTE
ncbi:hypothetical protein FOPG_17174 [Fusarium oxysporum f. sp. conglutinans race 2 54008]|uniref:Uncharacterized protein n=1 Tax=Fusarium oxysporum f. sp. conglutinans race 2 54008 TaxID=1089457 RepID=X0H3U2_FUSOX|nr:hypothetical protein FOPG_17174 [Fusarium oxysporum f. sp. conglutinans race 2 54008]